MANAGAPHTNGSQFFLALRDLPFLDYQAVAFGRVIRGLEIMQNIADSATCNERPQPLVIVADCGEFRASK